MPGGNIRELEGRIEQLENELEFLRILIYGIPEDNFSFIASRKVVLDGASDITRGNRVAYRGVQVFSVGQSSPSSNPNRTNQTLSNAQRVISNYLDQQRRGR